MISVSHLPHQPTAFIGRDRELSEVAALLADPNCHLLTLVVPGGIGKTRLALQPLASSDLLIPAIAEGFHLQFYAGADPKQQLLEYVPNKSLLLVLDNF